ncbi:COG1361 S-layer family protein [Haloarchaeobius litoreus]|uniref:COG1361 S-layer family protein n=1 Tax=Haloarchaeobius litoreus TaxID=755306 RepID=A0ABD6DCW8_9EURY|nr:hypothetical protein [Haloarchaeobius litoreus]
MNRRVVLVVLLLVFATPASAVTVADSSSADTDDRFELVGVEGAVTEADGGQLTVTVENTGGAVEDVTAALSSAEADTGDHEPHVGTWAGGTEHSFSFDVASVAPGTGSSVSLTLTLTYTAGGTEYMKTLQLTVALGGGGGGDGGDGGGGGGDGGDDGGDGGGDGGDDGGDGGGDGGDGNDGGTGTVDAAEVFEVTDIETDVQVGSTGTLAVTIENVGDEDLTDAVVSASSLNREFLFGRSPNASRFVGDWDEGEERTVEFSVTLGNESVTEPYPVALSVDYRNEDDEPRVARGLRIGVQPRSEQRFRVSGVEGDLRVGAEGTVEGEVENRGPDDAEEAVIRIRSSEGAIQPRRTEFVLGDLDDGETEGFEFPVAVAPDAEPGEYQLTFVVVYRDDEGNRVASRGLTGTVEVDDEAAVFEVTDVETSVQVGERGTLELTLENTGDEDLTDAVVSVSSLNRDFLFGRSPNATRFVGEWEAGEEQTVEFAVVTTNDSITEPYPVDLAVRYEDEDGQAKVADDLRIGVRPRSEQRFRLDDTSGTLRVGADGTVEGEVTNRGPQTAERAVVRLVNPPPGIDPQQASFVLGDLGPGESAAFELPVRVARSVRSGDRQLRFVVEYRNRDDDPRRSAPLLGTYEVREFRDDFELVDVDSDLQVGEEGTVTLELRNRQDRTLDDATVTLQSASGELLVGRLPNGSRFVGDWEPNETRDVEFTVTSTNASDEQPYPFVATVSYDDEDGDRRRSDPFRFGVEPDEEQAFALTDADANLQVGDDGTVTATVTNEGPRDVENAVVRLTSDDPGVVPQVSQYAVGDLDEGESATVELPVRVARDAKAVPRQLSFVVSYQTDENEPRRSDTLAEQFDVDEQIPAFEVVDVDSTVQVGEEGTLELTLANVDAERASDAVVTLATRSGELLVGRAPNGSRFVGDWAPNEERTVAFTVTSTNATDVQQYPLSVSVNYEDEDGDERRSEARTFGVEPLDEQRFALADVRSTLRVGEDGNVTGLVRNVGPGTAYEVAVQVSTRSETVVVDEAEIPLGTLEAGENASFRIPASVVSDAESTPRRLTVRVVYQTADDEPRRSDPLVAAVPVAGQRDAFLVRPANATVPTGGTRTVTLLVTNNRDQVVRNVNAKLFANEPLSVPDDQAFVDQLAPNETVELQFRVSAAGDAVPKDYPLSIDFQYEQPDGETELSRSLTVPVTVAQPPGDGFPWWAIVLVVLLVLFLVGLFLWGRREDGGDGSEEGGEGGNGTETNGGSDEDEAGSSSDDGAASDDESDGGDDETDGGD